MYTFKNKKIKFFKGDKKEEEIRASIISYYWHLQIVSFALWKREIQEDNSK